MHNLSSSPPKPITEIWRPDLVALPELTLARRLVRFLFRGMTKVLTRLLLRVQVSGLENFPRKGPAVIVFNHLGDADAVVLMAMLPYQSPMEGIGKIELNDHWLVGPVFRLYGVIWVHRGRPDRRALRAALQGLAQGRMIMIAPEGRESLIGGLEEGSPGAAFLALKSGAPVVPVALTGTQNSNVYGHLKRFRRASVTITVGTPFYLSSAHDRPAGETLSGMHGQKAVREGTRRIMETLASMLPESYRGVYRSDLEK
jgi:1-acyl-sn-glycerol-3-phosphate acyltransferase